MWEKCSHYSGINQTSIGQWKHALDDVKMKLFFYILIKIDFFPLVSKLP